MAELIGGHHFATNTGAPSKVLAKRGTNGLHYPRLISTPLVSTELISTRLVSTRLVPTHESKTLYFPRILRNRRKTIFFNRKTDGPVQQMYFFLVETSLGYRWLARRVPWIVHLGGAAPPLDSRDQSEGRSVEDTPGSLLMGC